MKYCLLAALLLASSLAGAQAPRRAAPADSLMVSGAAAPAAPDTAAALHRLFVQQRHRSHVGLGVGGGALLVSAVLIGTASGYRDLGSYVLGVVGVASSGPGLVISVLHTINYSAKHEQRLVQALQQHRLPHYWSQRALSPKHLRAPQ